jgi:hypothetical protein
VMNLNGFAEHARQEVISMTSTGQALGCGVQTRDGRDARRGRLRQDGRADELPTRPRPESNPAASV